MGILLFCPLILTCRLFLILSFLLVGIRWFIIRRLLTQALLWVIDGRILLIGHWVAHWEIGSIYLKYWLLGSANHYKNLMFWLGEVLLLENILFLPGTLP